MPTLQMGDLVTTLHYPNGNPYTTPFQHYHTNGSLVQEFGRIQTVGLFVGLTVTAARNVYGWVIDQPFAAVNGLDQYGPDGSYVRTYYPYGNSSLSLNVGGSAAASDGTVYLGHAVDGDIFHSMIVTKYAADGYYLGIVDDALAGTSGEFVTDMELNDDACTLVITNGVSEHIYQANGCTLAPLSDFTTRTSPPAGDNSGVCWLPDGGVALATIASGIIRYAVDGSVLWQTDDGDRAWSGIDVDPAGQYLWAATWWEQARTTAGLVNRVAQFHLGTGDLVSEFTPENTADDDPSGASLVCYGLRIVPSSGQQRRVLLSQVVG